MQKIVERFSLIVAPLVFSLIFLGVPVPSFAQEQVVITTYYPSPSGSFNEMRTNSLSVGSAYRNSPLSDGLLIVSGMAGIGTDVPRARLDVMNGSIRWGDRGELAPDQGGSIELGGSPGGGSPHIDFSRSAGTADYDARIILDSDRVFRIHQSRVRPSIPPFIPFTIFGGLPNPFTPDPDDWFIAPVVIQVFNPLFIFDFPLAYFDNNQVVIENANLDVPNGWVRAFSETLIVPSNWDLIGIVAAVASMTAIVGVVGILVGLLASDIRLKKNIQPLGSVLDQVMQLRAVRFEWRTEEHPDMELPSGRQIGMIAQELEKVFPEFVREGNDGYKFVDFGRFNAVLLEAIKEQQGQINDLKSEINVLKKQYKILEGTGGGK